MVKEYKIVISKPANDSIKEIFEGIKEESPQAANHVRTTIKEKIKKLANFPEKFSEEPLLSHLNGNYRSVSVWDYKIIYRVVAHQIRILLVIHGKHSNDSILKQLGNPQA